MPKHIYYYSIMSNFIHSDKVLYLKFPKLINILKLDNSKSPNLLNDINNSIININSKTFDSNLSNKFEKKNKVDSSHEDSLDNKKNKSKSSKKIRKTNNLYKDDLFLDNSSNSILTKTSPSLSKSHKASKYKKKEKSKNNIETINHSPSDLISDSTSIDKDIVINSPLTVQELSIKLNLTEAEIITYLFLRGISVTINDVIDIQIAKEVAENYKFNVVDKEVIVDFQNNKSDNSKHDNSIHLFKRAPIVTILGHVDHGKTTLLDSILHTNFVKKEHGGITQAINGYEVESLYNSLLYKLVFLDTPGHEAFAAMRLRGAKIADIALLVVAADDGLKPQTIEAIKYILEIELPYIVVINKVDKSDINIRNIKKELVQYGILDKECGSKTCIVEVSALTGKNINLLLDTICALSDIQNFTANPNQLAQGTVLDAYLDKKRGIIANLVIKNGTLKVGNFIAVGNIYGKIKSLINSQNTNVREAQSSSIIKVLGFSILPKSGLFFQVFNNEKKVKEYINKFIEENNKYTNSNVKLLNRRVSLDNQDSLKQFKLILKTDTQGSLEAIIDSFSKISQRKVQISIISSDLGNISSTDIELALTTNALLLGFNINISTQVNDLVKQKSLNLKVFYIIYDLIEYVQNVMLSLIDPEYDEVFLGRALVQTVFNMNKGTVAGCLVNEGKLKKMSYIKVYRENALIYQGFLSSLKRIKNDVDEVFQSNECGVMCDYNLWKDKDIIEAYDLIEKVKTL
uniref:Translation initiation factor IF-2, chloroplastic n=1 Tax=Dasya binghamiae TaxID=1896963 RepID=A0A1C8XS74_9FLOR|nr:translation initiation factor IF-2 [Dasya binghamiae]AOH77332.1 translation initiation factor IF-2 [Dasya binghamiae]